MFNYIFVFQLSLRTKIYEPQFLFANISCQFSFLSFCCKSYRSNRNSLHVYLTYRSKIISGRYLVEKKHLTFGRLFIFGQISNFFFQFYQNIVVKNYTGSDYLYFAYLIFFYEIWRQKISFQKKKHNPLKVRQNVPYSKSAIF